ncbi:MAG: amidohydrolase family protein, partial [Deltaproteobacteria bacterium]|nr:amidohydrolase family protein [Deltaproteobacteria bacterium]
MAPPARIIDMHVHYFPRKVFEAIWAFFDANGNGLWNVRYRLDGQALLDELCSQGVSRFTTLVYAHKPGMASSLNDFVHAAAQNHPELIPFGTIFAGDGDPAREARRIFEQLGHKGIKLHPFVSREQLDDERFFSTYELMQALGKVLVCHPGSGPGYDALDGAARLRKVLKRFPQLKTVIAHCGAFEFGDYEALAGDFEHVYFDTAMNCVHEPTFPHNCPGHDFFLRNADRVL